MASLDIYRAGSIVKTIDIDEKTTFSQKIMGENVIKVDVISHSILPIQIGDHCVWNSETYIINRVPDVTKISPNEFQYSIELEGLLYNLYNQLLFSIDGLCDFSYTAQAVEYIDLIVASMNQIETGWTRGTVDTTIDLNIDFAGDTCRSALTKIAEAFKLEFSLSGKTISLVKSIGSLTANRFEYGRGKGLYKLDRKQVVDQNVVTRVYGFGGDKNITDDYRSRAKKLVFEVSGNRYLEHNVSLYGLKVGRYINEDIFPQRTAQLTGASFLFVPNKDITFPDIFDNINSYIEDTALDFDLNGNKIEGSTPKIVFKTGDLSGNEFEVWKYDSATKRMYINPYSEPDGYTVPNALNTAAIGDTYTLIGIKLPDSYVTAAETELQVATQTYLDENSIPQVVYDLEIDPKYVKINSINLKVGDIVHVTDTDLGIDNDIRVSELSYPLVNRNRITATIADFVPYTIQELVVKTTIQAPKKAVIVQRKTAELARLATMRQRQLRDLIFDPDNYFDVTRIKPLSIETMYLAVGTKSQNFMLSGVVIQANYNADPDSIHVGSGNLIHLQMSLPSLGNTWELIGLSSSGLDPLNSYYLYAKCSKTQLTGVWDISVDQKQSEDTDHYYFLVGILYTAVGGVRDYDFSYGMTYVNGRTIKTGKIQTVSGDNYIDLDEEKWFFGDTDNSIDWNVTTPNVLTIKGAVMSDVILANIANIGDLLVKHLKTIDTPQRGIEINVDDSNSIQIFDGDGNNIINLDDNAGEDKYTHEPYAGISAKDETHLTQISKLGVYTNGDGYSIYTPTGGLSITPESKAAGMFVANGDNVGILVGIFAKAINATGSEYAFYGEGDSLTTGTQSAKGFCILPVNKTSPANSASQNLQSSYNLFINDLSSQNQVWYLPNPALYRIWEEIEICNWNGQDINLRPLTGDFINNYNNTQWKIYLPNAGDCCKLRSNGVDTWVIVSLNGSVQPA